MTMWPEERATDQPRRLPRQPEDAPLSVSAYVSRIIGALRQVGGGVVEGEVQDPKVSRGGVLYFTLTDGEAAISCKVFPRDRGRLDHVPKHGELVKATVDRPDLYAKAGSLNLIVSQIRLAGEGELLRRREELVRKLAAEGLTNPARRTPLPPFPRAVGVIAGQDSKALADVITALQDRFPPVHIVVCTALVQGAAAPRELVDALARMQQHPLVDSIVVARGGGSVQDLMAFDDERLCRAIFTCRKPVVTAIGHTDNEPVCNHIAWNAHTPSRSAELIVPSASELRTGIDHAVGRVDDVARHLVRCGDTVIELGSGLDGARRLNRFLTDTAATADRANRAVEATLGVRTSELDLAKAALASVPHRLPSPDQVRGVGALIDQRAHEFFLGYRTGIADDIRGIAQTADRLSARGTSLAERGHHIGLGIRRQLNDHVYNYGNALKRISGEARTGLLRTVARRDTEVRQASETVAKGTHRQASKHERDYGRAVARLAREAREGGDRALHRQQRELDRTSQPLSQRARRHLADARKNLRHAAAVIEARDFRRRGWLLAEDQGGTSVVSTAQVAVGQRLHLHFRDGHVEADAHDVQPIKEEL